jgi:hypothetical protein
MLLSRCRVPKIARHAALDRMNDYDSGNQSWDGPLLRFADFSNHDGRTRDVSRDLTH